MRLIIIETKIKILALFHHHLPNPFSLSAHHLNKINPIPQPIAVDEGSLTGDDLRFYKSAERCVDFKSSLLKIVVEMEGSGGVERVGGNGK